MTRPSRNTDRLLIEAGKALLPKTGISGLKVRAVCKKAGVNLGMFNYHFKTKEHFVECLLAEIYDEFFSNFRIEVQSGRDCREQLRNAILTIARFARENRQFIMVFIEEIMLGNAAIMAFAKRNMTKHISIVLGLVRRCQKEGYLVKMPLFNLLPGLFAPVVAPVVMLRVFEKFAGKGVLPALFVAVAGRETMSDKAIRQRIDIAFKGFTPGA